MDSLFFCNSLALVWNGKSRKQLGYGALIGWTVEGPFRKWNLPSILYSLTLTHKYQHVLGSVLAPFRLLLLSFLLCFPAMVSVSNSLPCSLFPSLFPRSNKGQCQLEWRQSHLVSLLTPTTVKHLPKISRHIACGAAGIQRGAEAATQQVAACISNEKLPFQPKVAASAKLSASKSLPQTPSKTGLS